MNIRKIACWSLLLAMTVIGANLKIMGSIAFDSLPAFLGALLLGPMAGFGLGIFGHFISAALAGFPFSFPVHLIVGLVMGISCFAYGKVYHIIRRSQTFGIALLGASIIGYIFSVVINLALLYPLLQNLIFALFIPLTMATWANLFLAAFVYMEIREPIQKILRGDLQSDEV